MFTKPCRVHFNSVHLGSNFISSICCGFAQVVQQIIKTIHYNSTTNLQQIVQQMKSPQQIITTFRQIHNMSVRNDLHTTNPQQAEPVDTDVVS